MPPTIEQLLQEIKIIQSMGDDMMKILYESTPEGKTLYHTEHTLRQFITCHPALVKLKTTIHILSYQKDSVLIQGETGTGKELLATALHGARSGKLVKVNCSGIPEHLMESEFFGHVKGSFTGAINDRVGKLQHAWNGTIVLDEVGDMPLAMQAKLLRALQELTITPVGSNEERKIDCRIVASTNKNIPNLISQGLFREDLYYRIAVFHVNTLPLRHRICDIPLLIDKLDPEGHVSQEHRNFISQQELKGNMRELQAIIKNTLLFGSPDAYYNP